jgi:hypothetical protein
MAEDLKQRIGIMDYVRTSDDLELGRQQAKVDGKAFPGWVAEWYDRLCQLILDNNTEVKDPLAPKFLQHWRKGKGIDLTFDPPEHLKQSTYVIDVLKNHRLEYLTAKKATLGAKGSAQNKWVGIIPRLQAKPGFQKWEGKTTLTLFRESNVDIPVSKMTSLSPGDFDLLTALHGFMLRTDVTVVASGAAPLTITFTSFTAFAKDRYDWDPKKHFPVPNPDFGNPYKVAKPLLPSQKVVVVYHRHAIEVEKAGLAQPYDLHSNPWSVTDLAIMGPAQIDPGKNLN